MGSRSRSGLVLRQTCGTTAGCWCILLLRWVSHFNCQYCGSTASCLETFFNIHATAGTLLQTVMTWSCCKAVGSVMTEATAAQQSPASCLLPVPRLHVDSC